MVFYDKKYLSGVIFNFDWFNRYKILLSNY